MEPKYSSAGNAYSRGEDCAVQKAPDTLPSLLDEIAQLSCALRDSTDNVNSKLNGRAPQPESTAGLKNPGEPSIIERGRLIKAVLREAAENQQRIMDALAL